MPMLMARMPIRTDINRGCWHPHGLYHSHLGKAKYPLMQKNPKCALACLTLVTCP